MELSIIIPVYNVEKYIARCLDSIYALPMKVEQFEVLCIDDCSPDGSCAIIEEYQKRYANLQLIHHKENKRQGGARNTGIREAKGEYCMFVDADDSLPHFDLLTHIDYMRENDLELLLGRVICVEGEGNKFYWANVDAATEIVSGPQFFVDNKVIKVGYGTVWMGIYNTELLKRTEPFAEHMLYEDTDWCFKCTYNAKRIQYKPFDMYKYHNNPVSTSHDVNAQKLEWRVRLSLRLYKWAQSVTEEREAVQKASEHFYTWNMQGLRILWKFTNADRRKFYKAFTKKEYAIIQSWPRTYKTILLMQYPKVSQVGLSIVSPVLRLMWRIKKGIKS